MKSTLITDPGVEKTCHLKRLVKESAHATITALEGTKDTRKWEWERESERCDTLRRIHEQINP